jgi:hypothetical protein
MDHARAGAALGSGCHSFAILFIRRVARPGECGPLLVIEKPAHVQNPGSPSRKRGDRHDANIQGSIAEVVGVQRRPGPDRGQRLAGKIKISARQIKGAAKTIEDHPRAKG